MMILGYGPLPAGRWETEAVEAPSGASTIL